MYIVFWIAKIHFHISILFIVDFKLVNGIQFLGFIRTNTIFVTHIKIITLSVEPIFIYIISFLFIHFLSEEIFLPPIENVFQLYVMIICAIIYCV